MGERHAAHRFLPLRYVFPGGAVERADSRVRSATPFRRDTAARLSRSATPARTRGIAMAAVRETFEETGLVIGRADPARGRPVPDAWRAFFATGMAPALDALDYVARAVTPPRRPARFNARFFMLDARRAEDRLSGSDELSDLRWLPINKALELDISPITARILGLVEDLVCDPPPRSAARPVPSFRPNSPLKKASLTGFHATAKHIAAKAVSPSSETMRTI